MSVNLALTGAPGRPQSTLLTTTSATVVLTASDKTPTTVAWISVVNQDSSARLVTLEWNDGTTDRKFWQKSVAANSTEFLDLLLSLYSKAATQTIKATAAAADVVTVTVVAVEDRSQVR